MTRLSPLDWFTRWRRTSKFFANELCVLRHILPAGDVRCEDLYRQAQFAPYVTREVIAEHSFCALIPYVLDDTMLIDCSSDVRSPELEVLDGRSHRKLRFHVEVRRGGFLAGLFGHVHDGGNWPKFWNVNINELDTTIATFHWLPFAPSASARVTILMELCDWAGASYASVSREQRDFVRLSAPATEQEILTCQTRLGVSLPEGYKQFVGISNGLTLRPGRPYEILGTPDMYRFGDDNSWAVVTPLYEEGCVAMRIYGDDAGELCFFGSDAQIAEHIGDMRKYLRESLLWLDTESERDIVS